MVKTRKDLEKNTEEIINEEFSPKDHVIIGARKVFYMNG